MQQGLKMHIRDEGEGEGGIANDFPVSDMYNWLEGEARPRDRHSG